MSVTAAQSSSAPLLGEFQVRAGLISSLPDLVDLTRFSKILVITDRNVASRHLKRLSQAIKTNFKAVEVPCGEKAKDLKVVKRLWHKMVQLKLDRASLVINFGGGCVCDVGAFAASTFMRGLEFVNLPTTLLSQVDASIGGKNGINFSKLKNYIGSFSAPLFVGCDTDLLSTLPRREMACGYAEVIKHALLAGGQDVDLLLSGALVNPPVAMPELVSHSIELKRATVCADPFERGQRKLLNLGHTVGHALEDSNLMHGEAVGLGLLAEGFIANQLLGLPLDELETVRRMLRAYELPTRLHRRVSLKTVINKLRADKKNSSGFIRMALLKRIGQGVHDVEVPLTLIEAAVKSIFPA